MNSQVTNFLAKERVCGLTVLIGAGIPHSATVHYSHQENPLKIFVQTSNKTEKAKPFLTGATGKASIVIGQSEEEWITLQMRGNIRAVINEEELKEIYKIHYKKHREAEKYKNSNTVFLEFTPTWWRYTDFNTDPDTVITSSGN